MSAPRPAPARSDNDVLRAIVVVAGIGWSVLFVVIGLRYELQLYGDGAIFSYAVAVQDVWAFHWHNISGRLTPYLLSLAPAEVYVAMTGNAGGGIVVYGLLFFVMPLLGLLATFAADRSADRIVFSFACCSTAVLAPLVFGFPTEMWMAHAWFWPALALSHYPPRGLGGIALTFLAMLALVFSHEGGYLLAGTILATLMLRGWRDAAFLRAMGSMLVVAIVWVAVKPIFPPGAYFADVYVRAALGFFNGALLRSGLLILLVAAIAGYGLVAAALARFTRRAPIYTAVIVGAALAVYWLGFDHTLHASNRYYMRTVLVITTAVLGGLAAVYALEADGWLRLAKSPLSRGMAVIARVPARAIAAAFLLVMLVHAVETAKFVSAWADYKAAVRELATGSASDPALGDPRFVSSDRIGPALNRLSWFSTTLYFSAVLADFTPARLVIDPSSNYFWLSCATATANLNAERAVPRETRTLIRTYTCQQR